MRWLPLLGLLGALGCSGSASAPPSGDLDPDTPPLTFDVFGADTRGDQGVTPSDQAVDAPQKACASWSEWSCVEERDLLCSATCGTALISCTNGGVCQCGVVSTGPCEGVYTGSSPCAVCQNALAGGCCAP